VLKVPGFRGQAQIELPLPCSLDFDVAANKYFYGLRQGRIKVTVLFSGTVFYADGTGALQVMQIPWDCEAGFHLAVETWQAAIDAHYPSSAWLRLSRDTFDRLYRYKVAHSVPMWDRLLEELLNRAEAASSGDPDPNADAFQASPGVRQ
jgi:hypothetical protein